jgi:hypothetical protein
MHSIIKYITLMVEAIRKILNDDRQLSKVAATSFMEFDEDKSGFIDENELLKIMTKVTATLNIPKPTQSQIKGLVKKLDHSNDGKLSLEEFKVLVRSILNAYIQSMEKEGSAPAANAPETEVKNRADVEGQVDRQLQVFEKYLEDSGISIAFQIMYTAMRLRQIGREVSHLLPANLTENISHTK